MSQFVNENIDLQPERQPDHQNNTPSKTPRWVAWVLLAAAVIALGLRLPGGIPGQ